MLVAFAGRVVDKDSSHPSPDHATEILSSDDFGEPYLFRVSDPASHPTFMEGLGADDGATSEKPD
jgi:hypothetical protein